MFLGSSPTISGSSTTTGSQDDDKNNTTTIIVVVLLVVITVIIIVGALGYTLYRRRWFGSRAKLERIRSIVNPAYGKLDEGMESVSIQENMYSCNIGRKLVYIYMLK